MSDTFVEGATVSNILVKMKTSTYITIHAEGAIGRNKSETWQNGNNNSNKRKEQCGQQRWQ